MLRAAAIDFRRVGSKKLWAGTVLIHPNAKTGAHHHGALESVIYVVRGAARMRWGERLEFIARGRRRRLHLRPAVCAPSGDQCAQADTPLECVLVRSDNESVVVNLNIDAAERVEESTGSIPSIDGLDPSSMDGTAMGAPEFVLT